MIAENSSAGLSTSWMLDIFGGNRASREAAIAELEAAELAEDAARRSVATSISTAYIELRFYQESIALTVDFYPEVTRVFHRELTRLKVMFFGLWLGQDMGGLPFRFGYC